MRLGDNGRVRPDNSAPSGGNCGAGNYRCFCASTLIDTPSGPRPVEALQVGDMVATLDRGPQPVAWTWNGRQPLHGVERGQRPVMIRAGALGQGRPTRDLILSPQHGVLVGEKAQYFHRFRQPALAAAQGLTQEPGVRAMMGRNAVHWYNFAFERHEIVVANGIHAKSLLIGADTIASMTAFERRTIAVAFAQTGGAYLNGPPARPFLTQADASQAAA